MVMQATIFEPIRSYYQSLYPNLTDEMWNQVQPLFTVKQYAKGEIINRPGEVCDLVSFINYGLVRVFYQAEDKEHVINFFDDKCRYYSDYESFLSRQPSKMFIEALEDTQVILLAYDDLQMIYKQSSDFEKIGRLIAEDLFVLLSNLNASLYLESPEQRYVRLMESRPDLLQRVPLYMIASHLGVTPEALSRIRSRISKKIEKENPVTFS